MLIWFALLIPVFTTIILFVFFKHRTAFWEFIIPFAVSLITILIMKFSSEVSQVSDTEYWSEPAVKAIYSEPWDEEVDCTHEIPCSHAKYCEDKDGKEYQCGYKHSNDGYYHLYDVKNHEEYWELVSESGGHISITQSRYNQFVQRWKSKVFEDQHRSRVHSIDGDWYVSYWPTTDETLECIVSEHSYTNRVQASHSVFNYPEVDTSDKRFYGLYDYPSITDSYRQTNILGMGDSTRRSAERMLEILNAKLGKNKQVKVFVLLFHNKPEESAFKQECYWKGGNKNEVVVCIGVNDALKVQWCRPFSFTEVPEIKIDIRNYVQSMPQLNMKQLAEFLMPEISNKFIRKAFKDFDYLTVEPKPWQVWFTFTLTLLLNAAVLIWIIKNEFKET